MEEWKEYRLKDFMDFNPKIVLKKNTLAKKITMDLLTPHSRDIDKWVVEAYSGGAKFQNGDTIMARITPCLENGKHAFVSCLEEDEVAYGSTEYFVFRGKPGISDNRFVYYLTHSDLFKSTAIKSMVGSSGRQRAQIDVLEDLVMNLPPMQGQVEIAKFLSALDDKIELNNRINHNLEEQAQALYKSWFVDFEPFRGGRFVDSELGLIPEGWSVQKAEELCEINIGKTPPRKEHQWFSNNNSDVTWISISDMGSSEVYISKSSEMLTKEACKKFNVIIVPEGTVLLSFKLTVGRVSIAAKELTTNEAIARFLVPTDAMRSYLYLALKSYDYGKLGSTSSIATAVNSKIIKKMALICPPEDIIEKFGVHVSGIFRSIKTLQEEISCLCEQRDSLLPRLMSGELKINDLTC